MNNRFSIRIFKDKLANSVMLSLTFISLLLVVCIGIGLYLKSQPILEQKSLWTLLTSSEWKPSNGDFGFFPFIMGTIWITGLAIVMALPIALLTAIYLNEYSKSSVKRFVFPALDILSGLPSVVYGVWGSLFIVPWISESLAPHFVEYATGYSTLAGGIVLGVMILPLLISLFVEILSVVPDDLRNATLSLGATPWQTIKLVVLRKSFSGLLAAIVLAISRAFGETIAVLMVCGNIPIVPGSVFDSCFPIPALIANNYGEMLSVPLYDAALMLAAFFLFIVVIVFNAGSRIILHRIEK
jgi:phosphate transport system permease protein